MLSYMNRVQQLRQTLKVTEGNIDGKEMVMEILNELSAQCEHIISALDALRDESPVFALDVVKSWLQQEEQRRDMLQPYASEPILFSACRADVSQTRKMFCNYCKQKSHNDDRR